MGLFSRQTYKHGPIFPFSKQANPIKSSYINKYLVSKIFSTPSGYSPCYIASRVKKPKYKKKLFKVMGIFFGMTLNLV